MSKPVPFEDNQVVALLAKISQRAAQTVREAGAAASQRKAGPPPKTPAALLRPDSTPAPDKPGQSPRPAKPDPASARGRLDVTPRAADHSVRYGRRRSDPPRTSQTRTLNEHAVALLQVLPAHIRLATLRGAFPRIVNRLAAVWDNPTAFDNYVDSLLIDTRGKRQGFAFPVVAELAELRAYHQRHARPAG